MSEEADGLCNEPYVKQGIFNRRGVLVDTGHNKTWRVKEAKHCTHVIIPTGCIFSSDAERSEGAFSNSIVSIFNTFRPSFRHLDIRRYFHPSGQLVAIGSFEFFNGSPVIT